MSTTLVFANYQTVFVMIVIDLIIAAAIILVYLNALTIVLNINHVKLQCVNGF